MGASFHFVCPVGKVNQLRSSYSWIENGKNKKYMNYEVVISSSILSVAEG